MNREQIIQMARQAGIDIDAWEPLYEGDSAGFRVCECTHEELERFAKLVRDDYSTTHANLWLDRIHKFMLEEREACIKIVEDEAMQYAEPVWAFEIVNDIKARDNIATNDTSQERVDETAKQRHEPCGLECDCTDVCKQDNYKALWQQMCERCDELDKKLAQQKPVACDCDSPAWCTQYKRCNRTMLGLMPYVSPPPRQPLTDEEIAHATAPVFMGGNPSLTGIARAIESAHGIKEKNT